MPLPHSGPASEVLGCSPFPEDKQAAAAYRPESPVTVASQSLQIGPSTTQIQENSKKIWVKGRGATVVSNIGTKKGKLQGS